jgi:hypothetical protein
MVHRNLFSGNVAADRVKITKLYTFLEVTPIVNREIDRLLDPMKVKLNSRAIHLIEAFVFRFLPLNVSPNGCFIAPNWGDIISSCPEMLTREVAPTPTSVRAMWITDLPLLKPTTSDTAYWGGIDRSIGTGSGIRCPSSMRHSYCSANDLKTSPKYRRNSLYKT